MKATTKATTTPNATTKNEKTLFTTDLLTAYEKAVKTAHDHTTDLDRIANDPTVIETLQAVGQWATFSTLKKVNTASANPVTIQATRDLMCDLANINRRKYATENDHTVKYNDDGDPVTVYNDLHKYTPSICAETLTDATDLLQTALLTIWTETVRIITDDPTALDGHFMTTPVNVRRLRRKVYIKDDPTAPSIWETVQTTPVQTVFKAVRREIENSRSMQVNNKYVYIDDLCTDPDDPDHTEKAYRRLDRLTASLTAVNMTTDLDGKPTPTLTTTDPTAVADVTDLLTALNLTTRQAQVLRYMTDGYGEKAIATRLEVSRQAIQQTIHAIRKKAVTVLTDRPDLCDPSILEKYTRPTTTADEKTPKKTPKKTPTAPSIPCVYMTDILNAYENTDK